MSDRTTLMVEQESLERLLAHRGWLYLRAKALNRIDEVRDCLEEFSLAGVGDPHRLGQLQGEIRGLRKLLTWPEDRLSEIRRALAPGNQTTKGEDE